MKEIGDFLKAEREKQGLDLSGIADSTKIHISKLRAIEEGDANALPAKVFLVGLIKSYARELKIDSEKINQLCSEAYQSKEPVVVAPQETPATPEESSDTQNLGLFQLPKYIMIGASLIVSLALAAMIYVVVNKMNSYSEETKVPESIFQEDSSPTIEASTKTQEPESTTIETIKEDDEKIASETAQQPKEVVVAAEEDVVTNEKVVATEETAVKKTESSPEPIADTSTDVEIASPASEPSETAVVRSDKKLVLTALEPVRAEIIWEDGFVQVMLLKGQETKTLVFSTPIKLRVNNGGAVKIQLDNDEPIVPGTFNQPIELDFK